MSVYTNFESESGAYSDEMSHFKENENKNQEAHGPCGSACPNIQLS